MKKVLTALLIVLMMVTFTACSKKEEAGEEELYTVNIKNDSGVTVYKVGVKNEKTDNIASVAKLENGESASLSMLASKNSETGLPDLAVVYEFENGSYVESVFQSGDKTSDFTITSENVPKE